MTTLRRRRAAGATADAAGNRYARHMGKYSGADEKASRPPAPWFRLFVRDWIAMTRDLKATEAGIFFQLLIHMHERSEPIGEDQARLARLCGADKRTLASTIATLLADGRLIRKHGGLWSEMVQAEIDHRKNVSDIRSKNVSQRYLKDQQNQCSVSTNVDQSTESKRYRGEEGCGAPSSSDRHRASSQVVEERLRKRRMIMQRVPFVRFQAGLPLCR